MTTRNSGHHISIAPAPGRVRVIFSGVTIADTGDALVLSEGSLPPVVYVPRGDVDEAVMTRTEHRSHCPFKGDASYFAISAGGKQVADAAWSYEQPLLAVAPVAGHMAFYPGKVDAIEVEEGEPA